MWACAWDADDGHYFYTGLTNGAVSVFDTRNTAEAVRLLRGASRSPVVSLQYVRRSPHAHFRYGTHSVHRSFMCVRTRFLFLTRPVRAQRNQGSRRDDRIFKGRVDSLQHQRVC